MTKDKGSVSIKPEGPLTADQQVKLMHQLVVGSATSTIRTYKQIAKVDLPALKDLVERVNEFLSAVESVSRSETAIVRLEKGALSQFGSHEDFFRYNWNIAQSTRSLKLEWNIIIKLPGNEVPQPHTAVFRFGSELAPAEMFQVMMFGDRSEELPEVACMAVSKVTYTHVGTAEALQDIFSRWYEGLPLITKKGLLSEKFRSYRNQVADGVSTLIKVAALGLTYLVSDLQGMGTQEKILALGMCFVLTSYLAGLLASALRARLRSYKEAGPVILTSGDQEDVTKMKEKNAKRGRGVLIDLALSLVSNAILAYLVAYFPKLIGKISE